MVECRRGEKLIFFFGGASSDLGDDLQFACYLTVCLTKVVDKIVETLILQHIVFLKYAQRKRVGKRLARRPLIMPFVD